MQEITASTKTLGIKDLFYPVLGEVKSKHYFSSYIGFFKNRILFALYKDNKLFLRIPELYLSEVKPFANSSPLRDASLRICTDNFYYIEEQYYPVILECHHWFYYITDNNIKPKSIRNLLNMNINLERLLHRNGIKTVDELFSLGEINIFVRLIKNGEDINEMVLFKLYGAIAHKIVYNLAPKEKKELLLEVDKALYDAGLRKRFTNKY